MLGRFDRPGERGEYAAYTGMLKRLYDAIRDVRRAFHDALAADLDS